jgi:hypothetical protein
MEASSGKVFENWAAAKLTFANYQQLLSQIDILYSRQGKQFDN